MFLRSARGDTAISIPEFFLTIKKPGKKIRSALAKPKRKDFDPSKLPSFNSFLSIVELRIDDFSFVSRQISLWHTPHCGEFHIQILQQHSWDKCKAFPFCTGNKQKLHSLFAEKHPESGIGKLSTYVLLLSNSGAVEHCIFIEILSGNSIPYGSGKENVFIPRTGTGTIRCKYFYCLDYTHFSVLRLGSKIEKKNYTPLQPWTIYFKIKSFLWSEWIKKSGK